MNDFIVAGPEDLDFVRALLGRAENAQFLTDFDEAELGAACYAQSLLVWKPEGRSAGLINCINWLPDNVGISKMAVDVLGAGLGGRVLNAYLDRVFADPVTHRIGLDATIDNICVLSLYDRLGFVTAGADRKVNWSTECFWLCCDRSGKRFGGVRNGFQLTAAFASLPT